MSFSATRLTCFALLSAVETDMRGLLETWRGDEDVSTLIPKECLENARRRRASDGQGTSNSLAGILAYLDFGDSYEALRSHKKYLPDSTQDALDGINKWVASVIQIRNRVAHTRPMEIDDSSRLIDVAAGLLSKDCDNWPTLAATRDRLSRDPSFVLGLRIDLVTDKSGGPQHNLPIPDFDETGFFGRQAEIRRIKKAVLGAYPVVSILGDGGIGKTSIALKVAYELLEDEKARFDAIVWVTAKTTILTTNEIQRISGAIENSLGLFASAAAELGPGDSDDPVGEVLAYLENFRVLLILDNLETVLDIRLREFLLDLPMGSKVILTSRISPGIENPVQLSPLDSDDSSRLLRALARIRNVKQLVALDQPSIVNLAGKMAGHPAYIRWFVAGVQAGKRPEDLIGKNELLLDYCMSNVYKFIGRDARSTVQAMQVLPGARNQAELAFLNNFPAAKIQSVLLELLTTNFVQMSSLPLAQSFDTVYQLSDFAKQYLDKHHPAAQEERIRFMRRSQQLSDLGSRLTAASNRSPYSPATVNVRGIGDFNVARLLRDAVQQSSANPSFALTQCAEAQVLAPSYYEAWRVEGLVRAALMDHTGAIAAYDRALELAPDSPILLFHYGSYLVNEAGDPGGGRSILQRAARVAPDSPEISGQIAWSHFVLSSFSESITMCKHVIELRESSRDQTSAAVIVALRAGTQGMRRDLRSGAIDSGAELLELAVETLRAASVEDIIGEAYDSTIYLSSLALEFSESVEGYLSTKSFEYSRSVIEILRVADPSDLDRQIGSVKSVTEDKGFAFVRGNSLDFFMHYRDLLNPADWEGIEQGQPCVFRPSIQNPRGPRAEAVRLLS